MIGLRPDAEHLDFALEDRALFRYVFRPDTAARESPKPYFHPLATLGGRVVTDFRPADHAWHHGLAMTASHLSGENFWGGPTYLRDRGYVPLDNNGRIEHRDWEEVGETSARQRLTWRTAAGAEWLDERRRIAAALGPGPGCWTLELGFALANVSGRPLVFGSPTVEGRPLAGYGGLFWRGPASFTGGDILAAGGRLGPSVMGESAPWLAFVAPDESATLVFVDQPSNPRYPNKWFVRTTPYACASCAFSFDEPLTLADGETLELGYRLLVADGAWSADEVERRLADA